MSQIVQVPCAQPVVPKVNLTQHPVARVPETAVPIAAAADLTTTGCSKNGRELQPVAPERLPVRLLRPGQQVVSQIILDYNLGSGSAGSFGLERKSSVAECADRPTARKSRRNFHTLCTVIPKARIVHATPGQPSL